MRHIGIVHRVKKTADGEARPTRVAILDNGIRTAYDLADEDAELDFVLGTLPVAWKAPESERSYEELPPRFLKLKKLKEDEAADEAHVRIVDGVRYRISHIADRFDGLRADDTVAMALGGSGDYLAYGLGRQAETVGARVVRIPPSTLKAQRESWPEKDASVEDILAALVLKEPDSFYPLAQRDRALILARESWRALHEAMGARIACEQRLRQSFIGRIFTSADGLFPEGGIEKAFDEVKASDAILAALKREEAEREKELGKALANVDVYTKVLSPVTGVGPRIAARIIAAVVDIRRFSEEGLANAAALVAESYARSQEHARLGALAADLSGLSGRERYARINDLARIAKEAGDEEKARHLYAMLDEIQVRSKLRRKPHELSASNLKAFMGVHLLPDGSFPRKRRGQVANWHGDARQALYLLMDQFFKRPDSEWGVKLRDTMARLRKKHPETVIVEKPGGGTAKKYNDLHIRKMAMWRTASQFVEWLYREWSTLDEAPAASMPVRRAA